MLQTATYKFRLYPTQQQEQKLLQALNRCRFVYNKLLEELNKRKINMDELQHYILALKKQYPELDTVYSKVLQHENYRLFSNMRSLAKLKANGKKVGRLRFKGKDWFKTFTYNQSGFKIIRHNTRYDRLRLAKIGEILFVMHREIEGKIKQVTIKRQTSGEWYACISAEIETIRPMTSEGCRVSATQPKQSTKAVGIDLGIINYIYDSDGRQVDNPKHLDKSLKMLAKAQEQLSRKKKGSKNRLKQKIRLAKVHQKITNQRNDFLHKLSTYYIKNYAFVAVEDLNIIGLVKRSYNAKNIMDAAWSKFIIMLGYKAERAGIKLVKVRPQQTTQLCSSCGKIVKKEL